MLIHGREKIKEIRMSYHHMENDDIYVYSALVQIKRMIQSIVQEIQFCKFMGESNLAQVSSNFGSFNSLQYQE